MVGAELLGHNLLRHKRDGQGHQEGGGKGEVGVAAHIHQEIGVRQERLDGGVGQAGGNGVGGGEHQVAGKASLTTRIGHQHAHHRVLAHAVIHRRGQGHQHDVAAVGGDVAVAAHEGHHQGHNHLGGTAQSAADGGAEQPGLVAQAHRHGENEHHAQGVEGGEVLHHGLQKPVDAVGGKEVLYRHRLAGGGVDEAHAQAGQQGAEHRRGHKQDKEDDTGRGQLVTHTLNLAQDARRGLLDGITHSLFSLSLWFSGAGREKSRGPGLRRAVTAPTELGSGSSRSRQRTAGSAAPRWCARPAPGGRWSPRPGRGSAG